MDSMIKMFILIFLSLINDKQLWVFQCGINSSGCFYCWIPGLVLRHLWLSCGISSQLHHCNIPSNYSPYWYLFFTFHFRISLQGFIICLPLLFSFPGKSSGLNSFGLMWCNGQLIYDCSSTSANYLLFIIMLGIFFL